MTTRTLAATALLVAVAWAGRAAAADYFVAPSGDDSAAGSNAAPWKTIQKAAGKVAAGDTVTVADGTYAGFQCDGKSGTANARIVFRSQTKGGAKITTAGVGADSQDWVQLNSCSYVTVDGFEVSGATRSGIAILGNVDDGSDARDVVIQNNHSHHNGGPVAHGRHDGIFSGFALNLTIQDNEVHDNSEHGIYVSNAADNPIIRRNHAHDVGVNCVQINADLSTGGDGLISNWLIEGNVVHGCGSAGFNLDGVINGVLQNNLVYDSAKGGITLFQGDGAQASHDNVIVNNTIFNPAGSRAALQVADGANNNVVFNNILYAQGAGLEIQTVTGLVHDYNFISSYSGGAASAHEAMPAAATLFADVAGRMLALAAASAALDTGIASLGGKNAPAVDIEGKPRPQGAGIDRGCYETGKGGPSPGSDAGTGNRDAAVADGAPADVGGGASGTSGGGGASGASGASGGGGASGTSGAGTGGQAGSASPSGAGGQIGAAGSSMAGSSAGGSAGGSPSHAMPAAGGCGCDVAGETPGGWALLGVLLAGARRGRRRRR
jgi:MYXO-CTERM domain-containing protein